MNNLQPIEHQSQRVLTTQQLAEAYGTDPERITRNYNRNQERYVEGKHYYCLQGDSLRRFKATGQIDLSPNVSTFYLWTEKGAWLHAKSLGTDDAWEAYEMLVDDYYRMKSQQKPISIEDMIILQAQSVKELKSKVEEIDVRSEYAAEQAQLAHQRINMLDAIDPDGTPRQQLIKLINRYAEKNGLLYAAAWSQFKQAFNTAYSTNLKALANNYKTRHGISKLTIPEYLEKAGSIDDALRVARKMLQPAYSDYPII